MPVQGRETQAEYDTLSELGRYRVESGAPEVTGLYGDRDPERRELGKREALKICTGSPGATGQTLNIHTLNTTASITSSISNYYRNGQKNVSQNEEKILITFLFILDNRHRNYKNDEIFRQEF